MAIWSSFQLLVSSRTLANTGSSLETSNRKLETEFRM